MSKIGKKPIEIPQGVSLKIDGQKVIVEGPKGRLEKSLPQEISIEKKERNLFVIFQGPKGKKALWGTWRALISNMILGAGKGFEKKLKIEGIGYQAQLQGGKLILKLGFSHPIEFFPPNDVQIFVEKDIIKVKGMDKEKVGQIAANIRKLRPPDPYKGKGVRYLEEVVKKKVTKKVVETGG